LERFLTGFRAGRYNIPWEVTVKCDGRNLPSSSRGLLTFDITPTQNPNLSGEFGALLLRAQTLDGEARRYFQAEAVRSVQGGPSDYFLDRPYRVNEAIEALRVANSPLVIPFLGQLAETGDSFSKNEAYEGLSKFSANAEARRLIFQALQSTKETDVLHALRVLGNWKERLPEADVRTMLTKAGPPVQVAIIRYMGRLTDGGYSALVEEYVAHSNPDVARAARQTLLQRKQ
jgi:hypothetical protein